MDNRYFKIWTSIVEIEQAYGVSYVTAQSWHRRGEIPRAYDVKTLAVAAEKGLALTIEALDAWHHQHKERRKACREAGVDVCDVDAIPMPSVPFVAVAAE